MAMIKAPSIGKKVTTLINLMNTIGSAFH